MDHFKWEQNAFPPISPPTHIRKKKTHQAKCLACLASEQHEKEADQHFHRKRDQNTTRIRRVWQARFYTWVKMNKSRNWHGEIRNYVERVVNPFFSQLWWQNVRFLFLQHAFLFQCEIFIAHKRSWCWFASSDCFNRPSMKWINISSNFQFVLLQKLFKMGFASSKRCRVSSTIWIANTYMHMHIACTFSLSLTH